MKVSTLLNSLRFLRACIADADEAFRHRVVQVFRDEYLRLFESHKLAYVNEALAKQALSGQDLARLLGYSSRSSIDSLKHGVIAHDKFELLRGTLGRKVQWISSEERAALAEVFTIDHVHRHELHRVVSLPFDREAYEWLRQALAEDLNLRELEYEGEERAWASMVFERVRTLVPTATNRDTKNLQTLVGEWGPAFLRTRDALHGFTC
jgi:hypothetical protein